MATGARKRDQRFCPDTKMFVMHVTATPVTDMTLSFRRLIHTWHDFDWLTWSISSDSYMHVTQPVHMCNTNHSQQTWPKSNGWNDLFVCVCVLTHSIRTCDTWHWCKPLVCMTYFIVRVCITCDHRVCGLYQCHPLWCIHWRWSISLSHMRQTLTMNYSIITCHELLHYLIWYKHWQWSTSSSHVMHTLSKSICVCVTLCVCDTLHPYTWRIRWQTFKCVCNTLHPNMWHMRYSLQNNTKQIE